MLTSIALFKVKASEEQRIYGKSIAAGVLMKSVTLINHFLRRLPPNESNLLQYIAILTYESMLNFPFSTGSIDKFNSELMGLFDFVTFEFKVTSAVELLG